jgi:hypothetical protein
MVVLSLSITYRDPLGRMHRDGDPVDDLSSDGIYE